MPNSATRQLLVVVHTHWDREWYHHAARFRQRLVALVDAALARPADQALPLLLDGQVIVLEDYLEVRPDAREAIREALGSRRIEAGPWFVLADLLIPRGESLIRNLLVGLRRLQRLGGTAPRVLYAPDAFGHPHFLPTIADGFGFPLAIVWRGYGGARWPAGDSAVWTAADGSRVQLCHLPPDGYEFGSALPIDPVRAAERARRIDDCLAPRATAGTTLLTVGADHHAVDPELPAALSLLGDAMAARDWTLAITTLDEAGQALVQGGTTAALPTIAGELRDSYGYAWALQGTFATRSNQKQRHAKLERRLIDEVEPLATMAWARAARARNVSPRDGQLGAAQLPALLDAVWHDLLTCHPHDTLAGCSVDAVARAMDARLDAVDAQLEGLERAAYDLLVGHDRVNARRHAPAWASQLAMINLVPAPRRGIVQIQLVRSVRDEPVGPGSARAKVERIELPHPPQALRAMGAVQPIARQLGRERLESPLHYPDNDQVVVDDLLGWCDVAVPALGMRTLPVEALQAVAPLPFSAVTAAQLLDGAVELRNGQLSVHVSRDGLTVHDASGSWSTGSLLRLIDQADVGDSYTPEPVGAPTVAVWEQVAIQAAGPLRATARVMLSIAPLHAQQESARLELDLSLEAEATAVQVELRGVNIHDDHRLRFLLATDDRRTDTLADSGFGTILRRRLDVPATEQQEEQVIHAAPLHRWVATMGDAALIVVAEGLPEYERLEDGMLALTLFRATGELSRNDLTRRRGHAGWPAAIPGAQQHGAFEARCWLARQTGAPSIDHIAVRAERLAEACLTPLVAITYRDAIDLLPQLPMLQLDGPQLTTLAIKPSEDRRAVIVRIGNVTTETASGVLRIGFPVAAIERARLDETAIEPLPSVDGQVALQLAPHATITLRLQLDAPG
jgi:mannosylglycerate hydrolase